MKEKSFLVENGLSLFLKNIFAIVTVGVGGDDVVTIRVRGKEKEEEEIEILQKNPREIWVKGKKEDANEVKNVCFGSGSSFKINSGTFQNCSFGKGNTMVIDDGARSYSGNDASEMTRIEVTVPRGTELNIEEVYDFSSMNGTLHGRVSDEKGISKFIIM